MDGNRSNRDGASKVPQPLRWSSLKIIISHFIVHSTFHTWPTLSRKDKHDPNSGVGRQQSLEAGADYWSKWFAHEPADRPSRALFTSFALSLLETCDSLTLMRLISTRPLMQALLHHIASDPPQIIMRWSRSWPSSHFDCSCIKYQVVNEFEMQLRGSNILADRIMCVSFHNFNFDQPSTSSAEKQGAWTFISYPTGYWGCWQRESYLGTVR